jgi:hypothetical protein
VDLAILRARELADHLHTLAGTSDLKVVEGHKVVDARPARARWRRACGGWPRLRLRAGDGEGLTRSHARFNDPSQAEAHGLLEALAADAG